MQFNYKITGEMKSNRVILLFLYVFITSVSFSQVDTIKYPSVKVIDHDTVLIFSFEQGKKIAKINEERKMCNQLNQILQKYIVQKDIIIQTLESKNENLNGIQKRYDLILVEKDQLQVVCEGEKKLLTNEIKKQKRHKIIGIIVGTFTTAIISYFYIVK